MGRGRTLKERGAWGRVGVGRGGVGAYSRGDHQALILDRRLAWFAISNRDDHEHDDEDDND